MNTNATREHLDARRPTGLCRRVLPVLVAACFAGNAIANPLGAQVVNGQVSISNQGNVLSVTNTPGSIINWQSFSINAGEITRFIQQNPNSAVLNRITGQDPSQILGALQSNGRVFLINPNGILFGQGAQVDVNGFVASTLNISNEDFLNGRMFFNAGDRAGNIRNQGAITTPGGGQVFLIAPNVENSGIITSPKGDVLLAAGRSVQLVDSMNPDLHVVISAPENETLNLGQVIAQGGRTGIYGALVRQRGIVNANSAVVGEDGKVVFKASRDTYVESGSHTSATGAGRGGEVHVLGNRVAVTGDARIDASGQAGGGTVLIGGDYRGQNIGIQNASQTFVGSDAQLKADAVESGDGGKVIVWGNDTTRALGSISAKAGANGGDGGLVETSAHYLDVEGIRVNASAPAGLGGTWLLDPFDVTITSSATSLANFTGAGSSGDPFLWTATGTSIINSSTIATQLDSVAHVVVDTTGAGTDQGNINVTSAMALTNAGASSLTLKAHNNINISAGITGNLDTLKLMANQDATGGGDVNISANVQASSLDISGANIAFGGFVNATSAKLTPTTGISQSSGTVNFSNLEVLGSGTVTLGNSGNVIGTVAGSVNGNINLTASGSMAVGTVGGSTGLTSSSANIRLESAGNLNLNQPVTASAGAVKLIAQGAVVDGNAGANNVTASSLDIRAAVDSSLHSQVASLEGGAMTSVSGSAPTAFTGLAAADLTINGVAIGAVAPGADAATQAVNLVTAINAESASTGVSAYVPASGDSVALTSMSGDIVVAFAGNASTATTGLVAGTTSTPASSFTIDNTGNLDITSFFTKATFGLTNSGTVTQTGAITATNFGIKSLGDVTLNTVSNAVNNIAADIGDVSNQNNKFRFKNGTTALNIGTGIAGLSGINININGTYDSSSPDGYSVLETSGALTQSAGATIGGKAVYAEGSNVSLSQSNPVGVIAGKATGPAATDRFIYTSSNGISIDQVAGFAGISHAGASDQLSIMLTAGASGISQRATPFDSFSAPIGSTNLGGLKLVTSGVVNLSASNSVGRLMAANTGGLSFVNSTDLVLGLATSTGVSSASNQSIKVAASGLVTVEEAVNAGTGNLMLEADSLTLNNTVTAGMVSISPRTSNRPITVGSTTCNVTDGTGSCLRVTKLSNVVAPTIGIGSETTDGNPAGSLHVAAITDGVSIDSDRSSTTTRIGLLSGAGITQTDIINVSELGISAGGAVALDNVNNQVGAIAARTTDDAFSFKNKQAVEVKTLAGGTSPHDYSITGISTGAGSVSIVTNTAGGITVSSEIDAVSAPVSLSAVGNVDILAPIASGPTGNLTIISGGNIAVSSNLDAGSANVTLTASSGAINGGGSVTAGTLTASAASGIGHTTALSTNASTLVASNTGANTNINIVNSGALFVQSATQGATSSGGISITNTGNMTVGTVTTEAGPISLNAYHQMTVSGTVSSTSGAITLAAVGTGIPGNGDNLTINGSVTSASGNISLSAGDSITIANPANVNAGTGTLSSSANTNGPVTPPPPPPPPPPTVAECTDNPNLDGCSSVLPSVDSCTTNPTQAGCTAVLPSMDSCTANPTQAGCSAVLPSVDSCTTNPTQAGCTAVLPSVDTCTSNPTQAGCTAVLPSLDTCTTNPTQAGCSVVLPSLATCTTNPTQAGCTAVLPSVDTCTTNPTQAGCSVVLPSLATCTTNPTQAGCSVVLPSLATCTTNPTQAGCTAVLPSLATCTTNPTQAGCSVVLPSLNTCIATPTQAGCTAVLPSLTTCTANPTQTGCSVVLPSLNTCIATPTQAGCTAVLPSLTTCTADPTQTGCSVVLPSLNTCIAAPTQAGCTAVLPSLTTCTANPIQAGCTVVLPSLNTCISSPTQAGCTAVLPALSSCVADPTQSGCAVVLPRVDQCLASPSLAGCEAVPTMTSCIARPTLPDCSSVLPTLVQCTADPAMTGCVAVLPSLEQCLANSSTPGCSTVINSTSRCLREPSLPQCGPAAPAVDTSQVTSAETAIVQHTATPETVIQPVMPSQPSGSSSTSASSTSSASTTSSTTSSSSSTTSSTSSTSTTSSSSSASTTESGNGTRSEESQGSKDDDKKDEKKTTSSTNDSGATKNGPAKKMYCN